MVISAKSLQVGDTKTEVVLENISRTQIVMYAGASGDYASAATRWMTRTRPRVVIRSRSRNCAWVIRKLYGAFPAGLTIQK